MRPDRQRGRTPHPIERANTPRISQRELGSYLWGAAVLLRGLVDAGDGNQFIFPLAFLKRLSDVYDEEHAIALRA